MPVTLRVDLSARTFRLSARGVVAIALLVAFLSLLYLLSLRQTVTPEQAAGLIRHYLRYQAGASYAASYRDGKVSAHAAQRYEAALARIDATEFEDIDIGRLAPDYLLSVRPTFYAKAVMRLNGQRTTRYFHLGRGHMVLGESSRLVWAFTL
jgi:hypothetical protein